MFLAALLIGMVHAGPGLPGLIEWRKTDSKGQACASCHSPDGIEIAAYGFSDDNVRRRALAHLSPDDAEAVVAMIRTSRTKIATPRDPMLDRPFQPGGAVLPGETPAQRDLAFAQELQTKVPALFQTVDTLEKAEQAKSELLNLDLAQIKIGIPFNRLSEDGFHGKEHSTLAHWIPDLPQRTDPQAQDAYLNDPSDANLERLIPHEPIVNKTPIQVLATLKETSLLYLQHELRTGRRIMPPLVPWEIGELGRENEETDAAMLGSPADLAKKKSGGPTAASQMKELRLPWWWLSFVIDPGLQHTETLRSSRRGDYFTRALWFDGPYAVHNAFMTTRKMLSEAYVPAAWNSPLPQHLTFSFASFTNGDFALTKGPTEPEHRRLYQTFSANCFRTGLFLLVQDLKRLGWIEHRAPTLQQIDTAARCLKAWSPETDASDSALVQRARDEVNQVRLKADR